MFTSLLPAARASCVHVLPIVPASSYSVSTSSQWTMTSAIAATLCNRSATGLVGQAAPVERVRRAAGRCPRAERAQALELLRPVARRLAEQNGRPHRRRPEPVGASEERGQRLPQLLGSERLGREQGQLPAIERLREVGILVGD